MELMEEKKKHSKKKSFQAFWRDIRFKYKLSLFNEKTLEEVWTFRLSGLSAFSVVALYGFFLIVVTSLIIIKTPIRNYLPGYLPAEVREQIVQNALRADSLERMIAIQSLYLNNMNGILTGTLPLDSIRQIDSLAQADVNYEIPRSKQEAAFVAGFEEEEKYNLSAVSTANILASDGVYFYKPVNGIVSAVYESERRHYGVDLVAAPRENVLATLDGTVVYAGFDAEYGNVIQIQHKNGFLSVYKHNELLLKQAGDPVVGGEAIAILGNTGTQSTGPHLHFELWYKGQAVNPQDYIPF